tara:strand:+ start:3090 stop:3539 length:450 start_codon:yes stop_codon:yes gene_type:complete
MSKDNQEQEQEQYAGEFKVVSDKGRIKLDLNWKWAVGIAISILGFVLYLVIDKYHFVPLSKLTYDNVKLAEKYKTMEASLRNLVDNQKILLDRSARVEQWMVNNMPVLNSGDNDAILEVTENIPGVENNNITGPESDSNEDPADFIDQG